ncbi:MAG: hypothetical protein ACP5G7_10310, partial [Anaerolineae bacterium]
MIEWEIRIAGMEPIRLVWRDGRMQAAKPGGWTPDLNQRREVFDPYPLDWKTVLPRGDPYIADLWLENWARERRRRGIDIEIEVHGLEVEPPPPLPPGAVN